jgi:hypothetical protein
MAEWKKVVVSGSAAILSQVNVGANQQITTSQTTTFLTGSFTGSFSGNGANLTGVTATAVFPTSQTTPILSTTKLFSNDGNNTFVFAGQVTASTYAGVSGDITIGTGGVAAIGSGKVTSAMIVDGTITGTDIASATVANANLVNSAITIAGTSTSLGGSITAATILTSTGVFSGSAQIPNSSITNAQLANSSVTVGSTAISLGATSTTLAGLTSVTSTSFTGSLLGNASTVTTNANLTGNVTSVGNATTIASGVVTSDMIANDTIVNADINTSAAIAYTKLNLASSGIVSGSTLAAGSAQGTHTLTTNGVSSGDVTATGLGTAGTPTFAGLTISTNALAVNNTNGITTNAATFPIANTTATTINLGGGATAINIGSGTGITTINHDARVKGALYVDGPITAISSSNLYVADQFILLASGSATNTDGGIVIDRGSYAGLNIAYGFDSTTGRWGYQAGVTDTSNTIDPTGISGSFAGYVFTEAAHTATKPLTGEFVQAGAIYTQTDGTIWMYA